MFAKVAQLSAYALIAFAAYQPTVNAAINDCASDARLLRAQLESIDHCKPRYDEVNRARSPAEQVSHDSSVYVPTWAGLGRGEDISVDEARARLAVLDQRLQTLAALSPFHRIGLLGGE